MEIGLFAINIAAAIVAGFFMGLEREVKQKPAGLKTNTLVALGASVFVMASMQFRGEEFVDITRVLGQVIVGVGFLGAGVIMQRENKQDIEGLTTAATIWCSAAAGCMAAISLYKELMLFTGVVVMVNTVFGFIDKWLK